MPATRSRRADVARTAAAAGLFSSCVRPADSSPRASSRRRDPITVSLLRHPRYMPSSRCVAIGNHLRNSTENSFDGSASSVTSDIAYTDAP